jgi:hypothetical protein
MAEPTDDLIEEGGLVDAIDLPYVPGTGRRSRAVLDGEPKHTDGSEMRQYEPVAGGDSLFTSPSAGGRQRYLPELPGNVGPGCEFERGWGQNSLRGRIRENWVCVLGEQPPSVLQ